MKYISPPGIHDKKTKSLNELQYSIGEQEKIKLFFFNKHVGNK